MSQDIEILRRARALLADGGWCQGAVARDKNGRLAISTRPEAVRWCAVGAIFAASPTEAAAKSAAFRLRATLDGEPVARWNDNAENVFEVLAGFDEAINHGAQQ